MSKRIFISYRREDTAPAAGRVYDRLCQVLPRGDIFFDINAIKGGEDFEEKLAAELNVCDAVLIFVGKKWLGESGTTGRPRLWNDDDIVRAEVRAALGRNIVKLPVLVDSAKMPAASMLPEDIQGLTKLNGVSLRHESFDDDVERILGVIFGTERSARPWERTQSKKALLLLGVIGSVIGAAVVTALAIGHFIWLSRPLAASIGEGATTLLLLGAPILGALYGISISLRRHRRLG